MITIICNKEVPQDEVMIKGQWYPVLTIDRKHVMILVRGHAAVVYHKKDVQAWRVS